MEIVSLLGEATRRLKNAIEFENGFFFGSFERLGEVLITFLTLYKKMATGKLEAIGYIFIWATSYLTISIKIAYFPLGLPENFLKKSFRKPPKAAY